MTMGSDLVTPARQILQKHLTACPAHACLILAITVTVFNGLGLLHTPSTAFWHLPPNSARFSYATDMALFISAQLSSDADSALRKV